MHLAAREREGHVLDHRHATVRLGAVAQLQDGRHASSPTDVRGRATTTPSPLEAAYTVSPRATTLVMPWVWPSARLCRLAVGWNAASRRTHRPADMAGAHGF